MPTRQRFKPAEREAFTADVVIEVLHGSRWVPAKINNGVIHTEDPRYGNRQYVIITYQGKTTRTVSHGAEWRGYPGSIRLPAA